MTRIHNLARSIALSGLLIAAATPALAGEKDRARQTIAEADAKIAAALQTGAPNVDASLSTEAQASLREAREQLGRGHERQAINAALKASELADRAMAKTQQAESAATAADQAQAAAAIGAAQDQAAAANARADAAQDAAQQAASDAAAARAAAAAAAATPPAPAQTTVTTSTETAFDGDVGLGHRPQGSGPQAHDDAHGADHAESEDDHDGRTEALIDVD